MSKIMLIDDDVVMIDLLTTLLGMEDYDVITPPIDENIFQAIQNETPDVILMDVYLKDSNGDDVDGLSLLSRIREDTRLDGLKIIISSGIDFREKSIAAGADSFLHKPYMPGSLIELIKK